MQTWSAPLGADRRVWVGVTDRSDGDLNIDGDPEEVAARRIAIVDRPWLWLRQVHGAGVVVVGPDDVLDDLVGTAADAAVTSCPGLVVAVHSADCATIALWSPEGLVGAVHAGWRGLRVGIIAATAATMRANGATEIRAFTGPSIGPECYEFCGPELDLMVAAFDASVVAVTSAGEVALDVRAAVSIDLERNDVEWVGGVDACTACSQDLYWSYRARADQERHALLCWIES
jgi:YfiH family protein